MPAPRLSPHLLSQLQRTLGAESASAELRWMRHALRESASTPSVSLDDMVARRVRGEPLQYILGTQPFGPLNLLTRPPVLIPRPETEDWALRLAQLRKPNPQNPVTVLDLCTGSGCIPLLLCHVWPSGSVRAHGVDISSDAIQLARDNAAVCDVLIPEQEHASTERAASCDRNTFIPILADINDPAFLTASGMRPPYDIITSNPPYIPLADYKDLPSSVRDWEDPRALLGDTETSPHYDSKNQHGLSFYRTITDLLVTGELLARGGLVALEVGAGQANEVASMLEERSGLRQIEIWKDPWGKERTVIARKPIP